MMEGKGKVINIRATQSMLMGRPLDFSYFPDRVPALTTLLISHMSLLSLFRSNQHYTTSSPAIE